MDKRTKDTRPSLRVVLRHFEACEPGMNWLNRRVRRGAKTTQEIWDSCRSGAYMEWLVYTAFGVGSAEDRAADKAYASGMGPHAGANAIRAVVVWPRVERALLDRYLRETASVSS